MTAREMFWSRCNLDMDLPRIDEKTSAYLIAKLKETDEEILLVEEDRA